MKKNSFVLKGDLCYSRDRETLETIENGYLICREGVSAGAYRELPEGCKSLPLIDCTGKLVIPGLTDLHVHAPQYAFRGLGMDLELLEWLETNTFPEESRYRDLEYAKAAYGKFVEDLRRGPNTRAVVFATVHVPATVHLMDLLEQAGITAMVGKVNMDRNCPDSLREKDAEASAADTVSWLEQVSGRYHHVSPILTPRFIPSCTDGLMARLGELQRSSGLPVQSHLSENCGEVEWVRELCPKSSSYGGAYDDHGLFGGQAKTVMAHCVLCTEEETALMKERGVWVAHCPQSNTNLSSGVAPVRRYLDQGIPVGLGSDVAGGSSLSILRAMADAIQASKLRWRLQDESLKPLTVPEAFWMGTVGGGSFFGKVGSFAPGFDLDAVVLDDERLAGPRPFTVSQRLERAVYLSEDRDVIRKFVCGKAV